MTTASDVASGKSHTDENFPVASHLIAARHRPAVMAFYHFVRAADDVADHATLTQAEKLDHLDRLELSLLGHRDDEPVARPLRAILAERRLTSRHAQDLIAAFRLDVTKSRTADWADLIHYCSLSAMPVGRYVLDVHGESEATWPASDAVCAALQIINHLQDCGKDFRDLDRVYIPEDALSAAGLTAAALGADRATPALRRVFRDIAVRTMGLLDEGGILPRQVADFRLSLETAVIVALARRLTATLQDHDPLSERVHHTTFEYLRIGGAGAARAALRPAVPARRPCGGRDGAGVSALSEPAVGVAQAAQAAGSSFYAGMRILPKPQREAMYAVYAFCRAVDDVADDGGTREERSAGLDRWRAGIDALYAGRPTADTAPLAEAVRRYGLDRNDFMAVIDGMAMDAAEDIRAPDEATLDLYCDRVASAVGRLSVRIFGVSGANGHALAHHLGRALQKTNILRDIDEDAAMGRLYLPREKLEAAGIQHHRPGGGGGSSRPAAGLRPHRPGSAGPFRRGPGHHGATSRAGPRGRPA